MITYSIIQKSQLEGAKRLDAECYQPEYLKLVNNLNKLGAMPIREVATNPKRKFKTRKGEMFQYIEISEVDLSTGEYNKAEILGENAPDRAQWIVQKGDIIISTVRPIRNAVSLIIEDSKNLVCSSGFAVLKSEKIEPEYLFVYLKTKPIVELLDRLTTATMYPAITVDDILNTKIYLGDKNFREEIKNQVIEAQKELENSKSLYFQAENLLLEELGLKDFRIEDSLFSIVNLSDVKSAERMDAEYFQNKYEKLISKIKKQKLKTLENFVKEYSTGFPFKSENYQEQGVPLIRINNIRMGFIDLGDSAYLSKKDYLLSPKDTARPGDIVLSMSGTIGMSAVVPEDVPKCSVNQRILRITPKDIDKNYLALLLNSIIGSYQLERIGTGGVQTNISYKDIRKILIPILPQTIQQKIADLVQKSHEARKKAKELLEEAKQKVENLIEK